MTLKQTVETTQLVTNELVINQDKFIQKHHSLSINRERTMLP